MLFTVLKHCILETVCAFSFSRWYYSVRFFVLNRSIEYYERHSEWKVIKIKTKYSGNIFLSRVYALRGVSLENRWHNISSYVFQVHTLIQNNTKREAGVRHVWLFITVYWHTTHHQNTESHTAISVHVNGYYFNSKW